MKLALTVLLTLTSLAVGCSHRVGDLSAVTPNASPRKFPVVTERVVGRDCATTILFFPVGNTNPTPDAAIDDALKGSHGADALVDAMFFWDHTTTILYNKHCLRVVGTAVRTK
jgi:hypothetical protein